MADPMETLFDCIAEQTHAAARGVLAHHLFAFVHPCFDGNGRNARFIAQALRAGPGAARRRRRARMH